MIGIIKELVEMPPTSERRFQLSATSPNARKWKVIDTLDNSVRCNRAYADAATSCHNLNKKHYLDLQNNKPCQKKDANTN